MNDVELRRLVREAVARHLGHQGAVHASAPPVPVLDHSWDGHASHAVYLKLVNTTEQCVIEPAVSCTHCNFCRSHGY